MFNKNVVYSNLNLNYINKNFTVIFIKPNRNIIGIIILCSAFLMYSIMFPKKKYITAVTTSTNYISGNEICNFSFNISSLSSKKVAVTKFSERPIRENMFMK